MRIKGDFLGFTYNGIHSSDLGIIRTSQSNRYTTNLSPSFTDQTNKLTGMDGTNFFGSTHTSQPIPISFAFDDLTESQLRRLRQLFSDKELHTLILDEYPYKVYTVKPSMPPQLSYLCFDELEFGQTSPELYMRSLYEPSLNAEGRVRHYKGEGSVQFIAYQPMAVSRFKYLDQYVPTNIPEWGDFNYENRGDMYANLIQWKDSVPLINSYSTNSYNSIDFQIDSPATNGTTEIRTWVYNPGDKETNFIFKVYFSTPLSSDLTIELDDTTKIPSQLAQITINKDITLATGDAGIAIDTELHLIRGIDSNGQYTGTIYNRYIKTGDFFSLPIINDSSHWIVLTHNAADTLSAFIEYNYWFY